MGRLIHRVGYPLWQPSEKFSAVSRGISTWAPIKAGEFRTLGDDKFYGGD